MRVLVLTSPEAMAGRPDTADTFIQAAEIATCLTTLGHTVETAAYRSRRELELLDALDPHVVFNLVEDLPEGPDRVHEATDWLDARGIAYTGAGTEALRLLSRKPAMKAKLRDADLPTPFALGDIPHASRYIVKSATEHASIGIGAENVVAGAGEALLMIAQKQRELGGDWFAEAYVDGREFNVAILDGRHGPSILPIAEILFTAHAAGDPRIVGYAEKWNTGSAAFAATPRVFPSRETPLFDTLEQLALRAWDLFALTGYARVDFRVDQTGAPCILEVNANPCLSADAGFCAAAAQQGLTQTDVVERILEAASP